MTRETRAIVQAAVNSPVKVSVQDLLRSNRNFPDAAHYVLQPVPSHLRLDCKASRLFAPLPNLPHLQIGRLDVAGEALGVKQRMRQPFVASCLQYCSRTDGSCASRNASVSWSSMSCVTSSGSPIALSRLAATRPANEPPSRVTTGRPAHSASLAVVWLRRAACRGTGRPDGAAPSGPLAAIGRRTRYEPGQSHVPGLLRAVGFRTCVVARAARTRCLRGMQSRIQTLNTWGDLPVVVEAAEDKGFLRKPGFLVRWTALGDLPLAVVHL